MDSATNPDALTPFACSECSHTQRMRWRSTVPGVIIEQKCVGCDVVHVLVAETTGGPLPDA